ncbi:hypothetical protein FACS1894187_04520 [Synergistales bacterium]|nr:hypothetical protein FACS1894187_04520 [Synergistales bacterium]
MNKRKILILLLLMSVAVLVALPRTSQADVPPQDTSDVEILAKAVYGEAGICSTSEQRLVIRIAGNPCFRLSVLVVT